MFSKLGQVLDQRAHGHLAGRQNELTAHLHTGGVAGQAHGNGDRHGLACGDAVEVEVEDLLTHGVELRLAQHGLHLLALEVELHEVGVGGVDQGLDLAGVNREVDGLAVATHDAGYEALAADGLGGLLAEVGTLNSLYGYGFHSNLLFFKLLPSAVLHAASRDALHIRLFRATNIG